MKYPDKLFVLIDNLLKLRFTYEEIFEFVKANFPDLGINMNELLDIIEEIIVSRFN